MGGKCLRDRKWVHRYPWLKIGVDFLWFASCRFSLKKILTVEESGGIGMKFHPNESPIHRLMNPFMSIPC